MLEDEAAVVTGSAFLALLVIENVRTLRLRDAISLTGLAVTVAAAATSALATSESRPLLGCVLGAAGLFALCFALELWRPGTLGLGTVKASALLGATAGSLGRGPWLACAVVVTVAMALTGLLALRATRRTLPTGPALALGLISAVALDLAER